MLERVAQVLVLIAALNWGVIGLFGDVNDPGTKLLGAFPTVLTVLYIIIGMAALYLIWINLENFIPRRRSRPQIEPEVPSQTTTPAKRLIAHKTAAAKSSKA